MNPCQEWWVLSPVSPLYILWTQIMNLFHLSWRIEPWCLVPVYFLLKEWFPAIWSWQPSRAYPVISQPFSCPYQDSVHIEFWMFCVGCVCFLFVYFWILKQWGRTSMWPSCLNNFLTNPEQKGQGGDWLVWYNPSVLQSPLRLSHFKVFKCLRCIYIAKEAMLMMSSLWLQQCTLMVSWLLPHANVHSQL